MLAPATVQVSQGSTTRLPIARADSTCSTGAVDQSTTPRSDRTSSRRDASFRRSGGRARGPRSAAASAGVGSRRGSISLGWAMREGTHGPRRARRDRSVERASRHQRPQIAPAVAAVELTVRREQLLGPQMLVEPVRAAPRVAEQHHRVDSDAQEPSGDVAQEPAAQPAAMVPPQQIDLVELAREAPLRSVGARASLNVVTCNTARAGTSAGVASRMVKVIGSGRLQRTRLPWTSHGSWPTRSPPCSTKALG